MELRKLTLQFVGNEELSLYLIEIWDSDAGQPRRAIRGKTPGALKQAGTFQWTKAVRAITLLLVRHALEQHDPENRALLCGEGNSLASSLDYAISKNTGWLCDMFGTTVQGTCQAARLFLRSNSNRKRPGPVILSINNHLLQPSQIEVRINSDILDAAGLKRLEQHFVQSEMLPQPNRMKPVASEMLWKENVLNCGDWR